MASRSTSGNATSRLSTAPSSIKPRQLSHLHSQLAQLSANLADLENLLRMTTVQAECIRSLGGWHGGLFMAASKVLGEETVKAEGTARGDSGRRKEEEQEEQGVESGRGGRVGEGEESGAE